MTSTIAIGVVARTGSAVAVALSGTTAAPRFRARRQIGLVPPGLAAQPYHEAAGMDLAAGEELIAQVEAAAEKAAAAGLRTLAATPPAVPVRAVAVVVKGPRPSPAIAASVLAIIAPAQLFQRLGLRKMAALPRLTSPQRPDRDPNAGPAAVAHLDCRHISAGYRPFRRTCVRRSARLAK